MHNFKNLQVWQKATDLVIAVYKQADLFPDKERYGLVSQINRCAVSIASNIAEGAGRNSPKEFNNFIGIALGSSCELETQLIIANRLQYFGENELNELTRAIEEIQKMLFSLQKSIKLQLN